MGTLMEAAQSGGHLHRGDGPWRRGVALDSVQCALSSRISALCLPDSGWDLSGTRGGRPSALDDAAVFGVTVRMDQRVMCRVTDPEQAVREALEIEAEKAFGHVLWYGTGGTDAFFGGTGARTVAGTTIQDVLAEFYDRTVGLDPIIHLGLGAAMTLNGLLTDDGKLSAFPHLEVVINPNYPAAAVAASGPIDLYLGDTDVLDVKSHITNLESAEATALAMLSLDPCSVVVGGGALPKQVYVGAGTPGTRTVTAYAINAPTSTTVVWGDATGDGTISASTTTGLDHTYTNPGTYNIVIGGVTLRTVVA